MGFFEWARRGAYQHSGVRVHCGHRLPPLPKKTANTRYRRVAFGHNEDVELVGPPVPECSNCQEPRAGGVFSDDGDVYLCPKCLAFQAEYFRIMADIDADRRSISENDNHEGGSPV